MLDKPDLPDDKKKLISKVVDELSKVSHLKAIVLGGSFASGRATPSSDIDFGLYYYETSPFAVEEIVRLGERLAKGKSLVVTGFYDWGPWVNGGAWIQTPAGKIDFLYRNIGQVERTIADAENGIIDHNYGQQPPYGFHSVIYLAETKIAFPLCDPDNELARLKSKILRYPEKLRTRITDDALWSAEFTLKFADDFAAAGDVYGTAGCLTRVSSNLTQAVFAINREYFLTDKRVGKAMNSFKRIPGDYVVRMERILAAPGNNPVLLVASVKSLRQLWQEVVDLTDGAYRSRYAV